MLVPTTASLNTLSASTHEYAEQPFIAMLCKPHSAEYNIQYLDYDTIQADDGLQRPDHAPQRF